MTRPGWQEPSNERELATLGFRNDQLERRFYETTPEKRIWAYMVSYDAQLMPPGDWWIPENWEEFACTPDTGDGSPSSILYPEPGGGAFKMYRSDEFDPPHPDVLDCYVVEVLATFFDDGTDPSAGEWFAVGNLMQTGGSEGNLDRHVYQPADMVNTHSFDHSFSAMAIRIDERFEGAKFFGAEVGNFCSASMWMDAIEMQVFRVGIDLGDMIWTTP